MDTITIEMGTTGTLPMNMATRSMMGTDIMPTSTLGTHIRGIDELDRID